METEADLGPVEPAAEHPIGPRSLWEAARRSTPPLARGRGPRGVEGDGSVCGEGRGAGGCV